MDIEYFMGYENKVEEIVLFSIKNEFLRWDTTLGFQIDKINYIYLGG